MAKAEPSREGWAQGLPRPGRDSRSPGTLQTVCAGRTCLPRPRTHGTGLSQLLAPATLRGCGIHRPGCCPVLSVALWSPPALLAGLGMIRLRQEIEDPGNIAGEKKWNTLPGKAASACVCCARAVCVRACGVCAWVCKRACVCLSSIPHTPAPSLSLRKLLDAFLF